MQLATDKFLNHRFENSLINNNNSIINVLNKKLTFIPCEAVSLQPPPTTFQNAKVPTHTTKNQFFKSRNKLS